MPSIPELTRAYLAAHKAKADAEAAKTDADRACQAGAEAKLAEAMMDEGLTRMPVDGRMVGLESDYLVGHGRRMAVPSAEVAQSIRSSLWPRRAIAAQRRVRPRRQTLAAALRGLDA
jgi:hypothetical protein